MDLPDYLSGPLAGELKKEKDGRVYPVKLYLCVKCLHVRCMYDMAGRHITTKNTTCMQRCIGCICDTTN